MIIKGSKNREAKIEKKAARSAIKNITDLAAYRHLTGEMSEVLKGL